MSKWRGTMPDGTHAPTNTDKARMDFMELEYHFKRIRILKTGILVKGIDAWQPGLRAAIDAAIELKRRAVSANGDV